jgi:hypothetical protein
MHRLDLSIPTCLSLLLACSFAEPQPPDDERATLLVRSRQGVITAEASTAVLPAGELSARALGPVFELRGVDGPLKLELRSGEPLEDDVADALVIVWVADADAVDASTSPLPTRHLDGVWTADVTTDGRARSLVFVASSVDSQPTACDRRTAPEVLAARAERCGAEDTSGAWFDVVTRAACAPDSPHELATIERALRDLPCRPTELDLATNLRGIVQ